LEAATPLCCNVFWEKWFRAHNSPESRYASSLNVKPSTADGTESSGPGTNDSAYPLGARAMVTRAAGTQVKLRCETLTEFSRVEEISSVWNSLWRLDESREVFQSFAWARAWWSAYGQECSLYCLVIYDGEVIVGILPLVRRGDKLEFLGTPQADYADILCPEARAQEVLSASLTALHASPHWKECRLEHLSPRSRIVRFWNTTPSRFRRFSCLVFGCYCHAIVVKADDPALLTQIAKKKKMREHANRLARLGELKFRFLDTKSEAREHLNRFFCFHSRRHALVGETSDCDLQTFRSLLAGLVDELDLRNELLFSTLELNGAPVAYQLGFGTGNKYALYQQTFDVNSWDHHPGNVLLRHLLLYAGGKGNHEFDFTVGDEGYKTRYTNSVRRGSTLYLEQCTISGLHRRFWRRVQGTLYHKAVDSMGWLRRYPRLYRPIKTAVTWLRRSAPEQLRQPSILLGNIWRALRSGCRWIYKREDSILFRLWGKAIITDFETSNDDMKPAVLGDIADLLLEGCKLPGNLDVWRERKARGDQLVVVREQGKAALVIWASEDPQALVATSKKSNIDFGSSMIVYESWVAPGLKNPQYFRRALAYLVQRNANKDQTVWVRCSMKDKDIARELSALGFDLAYHLSNRAMLNKIQFHKSARISCATKVLEFSL
jgi:CelD/BcsL family acetyltransferase involved in cellulose biosynthesis